MSRYAGQNIFYSALKKSGVRYKGGIHTLSHSFATHLMESGVELPVVQHLLGHSSLRTTALYLHVTARRLAEVRSPFDLIGSGCAGQSMASNGEAAHDELSLGGILAWVQYPGKSFAVATPKRAFIISFSFACRLAVSMGAGMQIRLGHHVNDRWPLYRSQNPLS
jgi:hypothetical protein